jgi:carbon-monoxide dehydrogenase iron sulfur subunit
MSKKLIVDSERCVGCGICELICSAFTEKVFNPTIARIRIIRLGTAVDTAIACRLCEDPPCVSSCPRDALRANENGVIVIDEAKCTSCGWCIEACEFGAIMPHPHKKIVICNLCEGDPPCVKYCPKDALQLTTLGAVSTKSRRLRVKELFEK